MNAYYTHQDTLNKILESFDYTKPVHCLEFGSGDGSSSVFNKPSLFSKTKEKFPVSKFSRS